jgi:dolichol-phosphate mannosyltransferase
VRKVLSRGASFLLSTVARVRGARDYTCGYRLYRSTMLRRALEAWGDRLIEEVGFVCMAELLVKLGRGGARVAEAPLVLRYDLKEGASKMKILKTITRYFAMARRVRSHPIPRVSG